MKKALLSLFTLLCLSGIAQAQIFITEIMYNPPESGTDSLEYIELFNKSNATVDLSGWNFTQGVAYVFPAGASLGAGQYVVLSRFPAQLQAKLNVASIEWDLNGALTNGGEDIELRDATANVIDYVDYKNAAPWPVEANGFGSSLVLCDPNTDNSLPVNWQAATTSTGVIINGKEVLANPGAASGCTGTTILSATNDVVNAPTGQATTFSPLSNDLVPNALTSFTILVAPTHGTATISGNNIVYTPAANYCGADALQYKICDATTCDTGAVAISVKCYPARTIAQVTGETATGAADSSGISVELTGTVYGLNIRPINANLPSLLFTLIDNTGNGISVSSLASNFGYTVKEKDIIKVRGTIGQFNGQTEIRPDTILKVSANNPLLSPTVVTAISEATESKFIKITNLRLVDDAEWTTGSGSSGFNVRAVSDAHPLDTILIRIDRDIETYNAAVPVQPFDLIGIGGQFDATTPFNTGYQVLPRYNPDISTLMSATQEADFSANVRLSPNPASDFVMLQTDLTFDRIRILNVTGTLVQTINNPDFNQQIALHQLPAGVYFFRFEKSNAAWTTRVVKQ